MIDVFLRCAPQTALRRYLAAAVYTRWQEEKRIRLRPIWMIGTDMSVEFDGYCESSLPTENFQWTSRIYAEERSESDPYIFADDDHLVLGDDWVKRALEVWEGAKSTYTLLSASSAIRPEAPYDGPLWQPGLHADVACVGAPLIHKKGVIPYRQFSGKASNQDSVVCDWLRAHGHHFALMKNVHYNHVGFGFSQVEPLLYGRY